MLATFLLNIVYNLVVSFINLLPNVSLSDSVASAVSTASGYLAGLNGIVPVITLITILGLFLTIEGIILVIKIVNWFIRKIPTIN